MDLKDFVETTLTDIAEAVYEAREKTRGKVAIAPGRLNGEFVDETSYVDFDLAVIANESTAKSDGSDLKTGVSINVLGNKISAGVDGSTQDITKLENGKISRISFRIPVFFAATFVEK